MHEINPELPVVPPTAAPHAPSDHSALAHEVAEMRALLVTQGKMLGSIRRSMRLSTVLSYVRFALFIIPLILALIYLPPLIQRLQNTLLDFQGLGDNQSGLTLPKGLDLQQLERLFRQSVTPER